MNNIFKMKKPMSVKNPRAHLTSKISANQDMESVLNDNGTLHSKK